jgi:GTP-binding protein Era
MSDQISRCGFVAIVGRPNVGKSTLMNHILGQKLSITSRRPQTTRHQVVGIKTDDQVQVVYVDTPGMHKLEKDRNKAINRYMNQAASSALKDVDLVIFIVDRLRWTDEDEAVLEKLKNVRCPVILAINKMDRLEEKEALLPYLEQVAEKHSFDSIMPISAQHGHNLDQLEQCVSGHMPESFHYYPDDQVTDRSERFLAAELVREKIMRQLGDEIPYQVTVEIEEFSEDDGMLFIGALILVERDGQKRIIIGEKGTRIKQIGQEARLDMERAFGAKIMLNLWVKVKGGWSDDERALKSLGYSDL